MIPQFIVVSRNKYATGLFWQPLAAGQKPLNFARTLSKQISGGTKFYTNYSSMVGVGSRGMGHYRGMRIAAIEAINYFSEYNSFLAEFFTPQGFWLVAVRNNIIIFDQLFSSESDAKREFNKLVELPDWGIIVASGYWNIPRAVEKPLRDVISGNSRVVLTPINKMAGNMLSVIAIAGLLFGFWYVFQGAIMKMFAPRPENIQVNTQVLEDYKKQLNTQKTTAKILQNTDVLMPYENVPNSTERANQCWRTIAYVMQNIPGWKQTGAQCSGNMVNARLTRTWGTLADLHTMVADLMQNAFVSENSNDDVTISVDLSVLPRAENNELKYESSDIIFSVNSLFQTIGNNARISPASETIRVGSEIRNVNLVVVNAESKFKPGEFIKIFDGITPVYMSDVKWDAGSKIWNYEVKIYAK
ncbi:MAG: type 4b pilus protein PilO2 [Rickettsiales bacterium]|nr:type 4b pilus protein PilO2 [Rickettsiales bacterium]